MQVFILLFNSFLWGFTIAICAFQNEWLEMRVNIGYIIPAVMTIVMAIYYIVFKNNIRKPIEKKYTLLNFLICITLVFIVLGFDRIGIVPAAILREAIKMTNISFFIMNSIILLIIISSLLAIIFYKNKKSNFKF